MILDYGSDYEGCYVCGKANEHGMQLDFFHDDESGEMETRCSFEEHMQGYPGIVHGGFIAMLLDEIMAKACLHQGYTAVTAKMETRFKKPVPVNEEITLRGKVVSVKGKRIQTVSRCLDKTGSEAALATALFVRT